MNIPLILFSISIFIIPLSAFAEIPDMVYKDHTYSIKSHYYNLETELKNGIVSAENALSGTSFENSDARKKIDDAWHIRWMAWVSNGQIESNLRQTEDALNYRYYKHSYDKLLQIDQSAYSIKDDLYAMIKEMKNARELEKQYQDNKKTCILFWCSGDKDTYSSIDSKIQDVESKIKIIESKLSLIESEKNKISQAINKYEITLKNNEIKRLQQKEKQQQLELLRQQEIEYQQQVELTRKQNEIKQNEQLRKQQQAEYEARIKAEQQSTLQILASNNPLLKKIMTGEVTFWVEPIPKYAPPEVYVSVETMLNNFETWDGVRRVYDEGNADIRIQWVREFNSSLGGQYWQSQVQVGLGQTGCYDKWQPFMPHSVRQILWHEIGHAMGYGHSNDQNNIMTGDGLEKYFYKELEDDIFLEDGHFSWSSFCRDGEYTFKLKGNSESNGFKFYVITPETDAKEFISEGKGLHYLDCTKEGLWSSSPTMTCNVAKGSKLVIYNPRDNGKTINVDVTTQYTGMMRTYEMTWDQNALKESSQYLQYLDSLR